MYQAMLPFQRELTLKELIISTCFQLEWRNWFLCVPAFYSLVGLLPSTCILHS